MSEKQRLLILTGPTAVGKSKLSLELAKNLNGEIISADSMQVYKHMDIGTDKVSLAVREEVPHHLIDIIEPQEHFDVTIFQNLAKAAVADISGRGKLPIIVGGTGFYIQAVLYDIDFSETDDDLQIRQNLEEEASSEEGLQSVYQRLRQIDPASCDVIPIQNKKRVIRALEFFEKTGRPISEHNKEQRAKKSPFNFKYYVLTDSRELLYRRIDERVDTMMERGLVAEAMNLIGRGVTAGCTSMQGLGYREVLAYLNGEYDLERAVYLIKRNTRHFAKRQLTWFRREQNITWLDKQRYKDDEDVLSQIIRDNGYC